MIKILHMSTSLDGGGVEMFLLNYYKNMDNTYDITVSVTYKQKDGGMPTEDLKQEAMITVLEDGEKYYVVGIDYTDINAKTDTN